MDYWTKQEMSYELAKEAARMRAEPKSLLASIVDLLEECFHG